jgi:DNA primase
MKAGLSKEGRRGPIDRFHRRLLWSIKDLGGDVVGFGARRLFDDDGIEAKYLNTSDTPVYHKTKVLFGLDLAKREIAKRRQVVVVEGYTDVMAMHLAGVPTAVASCGTAFGSEHISVIRRLIGDDSFDLGEVIYTFDGDAAGQAAALKAFEGDQSFAAQTFVAIAPDGQDPCELRQSGGDTAVRDLVARREPLFEFAIRSMLRDHNLDTAEGRVAALQRTVPLVARIKREDLRDEYARRLAGWTSWDDIAMVVRRVREAAGAPAEAGRGSRNGRREPVAPPPKDDPRPAPAAGGAQSRAADPGGCRAELRRAARAGVRPPGVRRGAPRRAGCGRGVRRSRRPRMAGCGARRVLAGGPAAGQGAGGGAARAAEAQHRRGPLRRQCDRRGAAGAGRGAGR